jgi:hypothetical protein
LQRFAFALVAGHRVRLNPQVVLSPEGALPLVVRERQQAASNPHTERGSTPQGVEGPGAARANN